MADLGVALRRARLAAGMTQAALAARAGVSRQWVSEVEAGKRPGAELSLVLRALSASGARLAVILPDDAAAQDPVGDRRLDATRRAELDHLRELGVV